MKAASSTPQSQSKDREHRLPKRSYVFVVTALAVFFVGLVVWRVPISFYVVQARVGCDVQHEQDTEPPRLPETSRVLHERRDGAAHLLSELTTPEQLRDAIDFANSQAPAPVFASGNALRDSDVKSLIKHLNATVREKNADAMTIELSFESPHRDWAVAFLNQLARRTVRPAKPMSATPLRSNRELREARWQLDEARHYERKAQYAVESFVDNHFDQIASGELESLTADVASQPPAAPTDHQRQLDGGQQATEERNPELDRLQRDLDTALVRRDRLMRQFTSDHPQVQDLTLQVEDLQQRLAGISPSTSGSVALPSSAFPTNSDPNSPELQDATAGPPDGGATMAASQWGAGIVEQYLALRERLHRASENRELAEDTYEEQLDLRTTSRPAVSEEVASRWMVSPAEVVGHRGGNLPPARVLVIGLGSVACGLVMAWLAGTLQALLRVNSVQDIQTLTELPLVGQLSLDPVVVNPQRLATRQRFVRWGTLGCEVTLGLLVLTFVLTVMAGSPSFRQFADNPFGIFAETIAQACQTRP